MKALLLAFLLIILTLLGWLYVSDVKELDSELQTRISESYNRQVYVLNEKKWTTFPLPDGTESLKIVTNADIPASLVTTPIDSWRYSIEYQLIKADGSVFQTFEYNFQATLNKFKDPRYKKPVTASFYFDPSLLPTDGKVIVINFDGLPDISAIRVRIKSKDTILQNILFRASIKETIPDYRQRFLWARMSQDKKEFKAKGNVYPPELLLEKEIHNLLTETDIPLGPTGITGADYVSRTLYVSKDIDLDVVPPPILPSGLFVDSIVHGVIPLPEGANTIRLIFSNAGLGLDPPIGSKITINWSGRTAQERAQYDLVWLGKEIQWAHSFDGGMLEISANTQLIVRAINLTKSVEITPLPLYIRSFISDNNNAVQFKINHINQLSTPFRVDLRYLFPQKTGAPNTPIVDYSLLDKKDATLKTGQILVDSLRTQKYRIQLLSHAPTEAKKQEVATGNSILIYKNQRGDYIAGFLKATQYSEAPIKDVSLHELLKNKHFNNTSDGDPGLKTLISHYVTLLGGQVFSSYERIAADPFNQRVSNFAPYYFLLPDNVAAIKFTSEQPVLITAFNRPSNLERRASVPEDFYHDDPKRVQLPAWFNLKPIDYEKLLLNNRSILLTTQHRPTEDKEDLLTGNYVWEQYHPQGQWLGRNLLTPIEDFSYLHENALPSTFQTVLARKKTGIILKGVGGVSVVQPTLAYTQLQNSSVPITLFVDGKQQFSGEVNNKTGEILLPPMKVGLHHFYIATKSDATFYINYVAATPSGKLKRLVNYLDKKGLTFAYKKEAFGEEILTARLYAPYKNTARTVVQVSVEAVKNQSVGPLQYWSFLDRIFDIRPNPENGIFVLGTDGQMVDAGELFSIPLGEDIPPGVYKVHMRLLEGAPGYISLARVTRGDVEERKIFIQPEVRNVQQSN